MFVFTLKWNKKLAILIILAAAIVLCTLIVSIAKSGSNNAAGIKVKTNEDRQMFLESLGWEVDSNPLEEKKVIIPKEFSKVYKTYNNLQLEQGFDLSKYCGLEVTIYTYKIINYPGYIGDVVAELYVLNYEVVGGDVHSLALDGFMHGLRRSS